MPYLRSPGPDHPVRSTSILLAVVAMAALAACGDSDAPAAVDTVPTVPPPTAPAPTPVPPTTASNEAGFGAPAAAPGEFGELPGTEIAGTAELAPNGCWYVSANGDSGLLVAPPGTLLGDDGAGLVTADGTVIVDGAPVDATGGLVALDQLPGGADGRWGNYATFCDPTFGAVVVADTLVAAFDPAAADLEGLAAELDASVFDTDYGCGFGFTTGDAVGRWALRIDALTGEAPAAGPVTLPDERFDVSVTVGAHLFSNHCDDAMEWFEPAPTPAARWQVTSGQFTYPETSGQICAGEPPATTTLVGAVVDTTAGPVELEPIEITNTSFGCFAG